MSGAEGKRIVGTVAKRGELFVHETEHSFTLLHGGAQRRIAYELGVVTSVTHEGRVRAFRVLGDTFIYKGTPSPKISLVKGCVDTSALEAAYIARGESHARGFTSLDAARDFIRPHVLRSGAGTNGATPTSRCPPAGH